MKQLKEMVYEANMELWHRNLVIYTWGNVSQIDRDKGVVAIKPSGVPYDKLTADMIVVLRRPDAPCAVPGVCRGRRRDAHPLPLRHGLGAGGPRHPLLRNHPRRLLPRRHPDLPLPDPRGDRGSL